MRDPLSCVSLKRRAKLLSGTGKSVFAGCVRPSLSQAPKRRCMYVPFLTAVFTGGGQGQILAGRFFVSGLDGASQHRRGVGDLNPFERGESTLHNDGKE